MSTETTAAPTGLDECASTGRAVRVAIVPDFREEFWPSMDLVADMLYANLCSQFSREMAVTQLHPAFRRRFARVPIFPSKVARNADRLMNRLRDYPVWLRKRRGDYDLFHIVDHSYSQLIHSLPADRTVVTCHDLDTFRCILDPARDPRPAWFRTMSRRILDGFKRAAQVIAVSSTTRDELVRRGLFPENQVSVIPNGVHPSCSPLPDPSADAAIADMIGADGLRAPLLISVGNTLPRKRLDVLLRVFAVARREVPQVRLLRVGGFAPEHRELARSLDIQDAMITLPFLTRELLAAVYRRGTLLVHTSEAEGFGLPVVEAMACGCPVIATDIPVLREVGGRAASYSSLEDVSGWAATIVHLLDEKTQQPERWDARVQAGIANAGRFSWAENARLTRLVYRKVLAQQ